MANSDQRFKSLQCRQLERWVRSMPIPLVFTYLGIVIAAALAFGKSAITLAVELPTWSLVVIIAAVILGAWLIWYQTNLNYKRKTYDPTWGLKYQDRFDEIGSERLRAATLLRDKTEAELKDLSTKEKREELAEIDEVLDFFEDVGFYMQGDYISPEVAYHQFFHWLQGYYLSAADTYIKAWRDRESGRWKHLRELYYITCEIERKEKNVQEKFDRDEFLVGEIETAKQIQKIETHLLDRPS